MADGSKIEWTEATWNPITGCTVAGPGCRYCYAMTLAGTRMKHHPSRAGLTKPGADGPLWTGEVRFNEQWLDQPLRWRASREIFVNAHGDTFHDAVPDEWIDRLFAVMALSPQHIFQVLTKRSARMRAYFDDPATHNRVADATADLASAKQIEPPDQFVWPSPNVWLGVSAENQAAWDERVPDLKATPAALRWVSGEPLLGPIDPGDMAGLHWLVIGGESDRLGRARYMHPDWVRDLRTASRDAGVAFFFKQWGDWLPFDQVRSKEQREAVSTTTIESNRTGNGKQTVTGAWSNGHKILPTPGVRPVQINLVGKALAGRLLDGSEYNEMPAMEASHG